MGERRRVGALKDGFDAALVVGGAGGRAATGLAQRLPTLTTATGEVAADPATAREQLRERGVLRPLIWIEDGEPQAWADTFPRAFLVDGRGRSKTANPAADLTVTAAAPTVEDTDRAFAWGAAADVAVAETSILRVLESLLNKPKALNVLVLYDDNFAHIKTVEEHLRSFSRYSRFNYFYLPGSDPSNIYPAAGKAWPDAWDLSMFDVVIWHYSLRAAFDWHAAPAIREQLARYDGLKVLFTQDDYDNTETTWGTITDLGFQLVLNCIPPESLPHVFPKWRPGSVEFVRTLTGYVPEDDMDRFLVPLAERDIRLAYRGRFLPYRYGDLGREKYLIGARMRALAIQRDVPVDIEVDDDSRIYGDDWYRFTARARATLASESGSNIFDADGSVVEAGEQAMRDGVSYADFHAEHLAEKEAAVHMAQVSPRIFEAIRLRTALVCFEGDYSGVIQPNLHYIPLKKDYSNVDEVFARLEDLDFLKAMTDRAYAEVIESGKWTFRSFVDGFDDLIEARVLRSARYDLISAPAAKRDRRTGELSIFTGRRGLDFALNTTILKDRFKRAALADAVDTAEAARIGDRDLRSGQPPLPPAGARRIASIPVASLINIGESQVTPGDSPTSVKVVAVPQAWSYVAYANMDQSAAQREHEHVWLVGRFADVGGSLFLSSYNPNISGSLSQVPIPIGPGPFEVAVRVKADDNALLLHKAETTGAGSATFLGASVVAAPAYPRDLVVLAIELRDRGLLALTEASARVTLQEPRPETPPSDAVVTPLMAPRAQSLIMINGEAKDLDAAVRVSAEVGAWNYIATATPRLSSDLLKHNYAWLRLTLRNVTGDVAAALWDRGSNQMRAEQRIMPQEKTQTVTMIWPEDGAAEILLRAHEKGGPASFDLVEAGVITASKHPAWLQSFAVEMLQQGAPRGIEPGPQARPLATVDVSGLHTDPAWGATVAPAGNGVVVRPSATPWSFAAALPLETPADATLGEWLWVSATLGEVDGDVGLALWRPSTGEILAEARPRAHQTVHLPADAAGDLRLVVQGGAKPEGTRLTLTGVSLLTEPRHGAAVTALAKTLARRAQGGEPIDAYREVAPTAADRPASRAGGDRVIDRLKAMLLG